MKTRIEEIVLAVYGIGAYHPAAALALTWAARRIEDKKVAERELKRVNRKREKMGMVTLWR